MVTQCIGVDSLGGLDSGSRRSARLLACIGLKEGCPLPGVGCTCLELNATDVDDHAKDVIIGDDISVNNFQNYSDYTHQHEFTGENCGVEEFKAEHVTKLSFDGHHKVHCQLLEGDRIPAHTGRPRSEDAEKPFENGHMVVASGDGYILYYRHVRPGRQWRMHRTRG